MTASIAVARHLARDVKSGGRRVSAFLNPSGTDLVVLAEDAGRNVRLDSLEMQYYRWIATDPQLAEHLTDHEMRVRYSHSCRDVSGRISQELISLHSSIASRAVRTVMQCRSSSIAIWRADDRLGVTRCEIGASATLELVTGSWTISTDLSFLDKIRRLREAKIPNETGGILIGSRNVSTKMRQFVKGIQL